MTVYLDTSVAVALFVPDPFSSRARAWSASRPRVVFSRWTLVEFSSALSLHVKAGRLTAAARENAERRLTRAALSGPLLEILPEDLDYARTLVQEHENLRAPDALHLAIALGRAMALATFDDEMAKVGRLSGLEVVEL